jgi:hypothetical protein
MLPALKRQKETLSPFLADNVTHICLATLLNITIIIIILIAIIM